MIPLTFWQRVWARIAYRYSMVFGKIEVEVQPANQRLSLETSRRLLGIHINQAGYGPTYIART